MKRLLCFLKGGHQPDHDNYPVYRSIGVCRSTCKHCAAPIVQDIDGSWERESFLLNELSEQTMTAHTPGPWRVYQAGGQVCIGDSRPIDSFDSFCDSLIVTVRNSANPDADARLIAASPDLYKWAKAALAATSEEEAFAASQNLKTAIAKVEAADG